MREGILGKKIGMTQFFTDSGKQIPVTVLEAGPCIVLAKKDKKKDGYTAVQIGYEEVPKKRLNRPKRGFLEKHKLPYIKYIREIQPENMEKYEQGKRIVAEDVFSEGDLVDVVGTSKGKGFAGVMKRWNFKGGPATHGSMFHRSPGSIGQAAYPSRVFKGMKMPGRMGGKRVTTRNLEVIEILKEKNIILIKGSVPGAKGSLVFIRKTALS